MKLLEMVSSVRTVVVPRELGFHTGLLGSVVSFNERYYGLAEKHMVVACPVEPDWKAASNNVKTALQQVDPLHTAAHALEAIRRWRIERKPAILSFRAARIKLIEKSCQ